MGWIKLYDKMLSWEWYGNTNMVRVFLHCLLKANYQPKEWKGIVVGRGQFITSVATLSSELGLTTKQIRGTLEGLQKTNEVAIKTTNKYSIVTITNYDTYQAPAELQGQAERQAEGQTKGKQKGNNYRQIDIIDYTDIKNSSSLRSKSKNPSKAQGLFNINKYLQDNGVSEQHITDWLRVRKEKKATNTLTAMENIEREIAKAGLSWDAAVQICIEESWKGFRAPWYFRLQGESMKDDKPATPDNYAEQDRLLHEQIRQARAARGEKEGKYKDL